MRVSTRFTVISRQRGAADFTVIILNKPAGFTYSAGQCVSVGFPDMAEEARMFSLASSPSETMIILLVKHGLSDFKRRLMAVKPGDELQISQPVGGYEFDEHLPAVLIAGGMGIAPFRSIIKHHTDFGRTQQLTLIHLHPTNQSPFAEDFHELHSLNRIRFISLTSNDKRQTLQELLPQQIRSEPSRPIYYLAGSADMVADCRQTLEMYNVHPGSIRNDRFTAALPVGP